MTGPVLTTERFTLSRPAAADLTHLCALIDDEETRRYLGPASAEKQPQFDRLMRNAGSWALYGYGMFMVRPHGEDGIVASCGVFHSWRGFGPESGMDDVPEAGWIVRRDWWGQGVAGEVMQAALAWFDREHGPRRIACMIEEGNTASERLAARLGFVRYGSHMAEDVSPPVRINLYQWLARPS
ncbi:GNAT family N-acetyltransferase [Novosphingobium gossypii]|uniref:GNAT family N-acetyltransferase n=1 Tax=Novosphingobium gossypii TaxID=1604774 RepID=UPI003D19FDD0